MHTFRRLHLVAALAALAAIPAVAHAQMGPVIQGSWAKQLDAKGIGLGSGFSMGQLTDQSGFWGQATIDYFFVDKFKVPNSNPVRELDHSYYEFNVNFIKTMKFVPGLFLGPGLNYSTERIDSGKYPGEEGGANMGVNLVGGFHFGPLKQAPFVQARYELGGGKQFVVSVGVAF